MPTWQSFAAFNADLQRMARDLERDEARRITKEMAEAGQKIAERAASADLGGDPKFSGWRPRLDTQVKTARGGSGAVLMPTRSSAGPWTVAERGRNAGGGVGRFQGPGLNVRTGRRTRNLAGRNRRGGVRWNGVTAGKSTASDAQAQMERELPKIAEKRVRQAIVKRFDVT